MANNAGAVPLPGYKIVAGICGTIDFIQAMLFSGFFDMVARYTWKRDSSAPGSNPSYFHYMYSQNGVRFPLRGGGDFEDWLASLAFTGVQTYLLSLGLFKLFSSVGKNVSRTEWKSATGTWLKVQLSFIFLELLAGVGSPLQFYMPSSLICYTLACHTFSFVLMLVYRNHFVQNYHQD